MIAAVERVPSGHAPDAGDTVAAVDRLTELWIAARDGDQRALAQAISASQVDVWRFVRHLVGTELAEDTTQDTLVRAWRALPAFRGESTARTWLLAIARRAAADAVRSEQRRRRRVRAVEALTTDTLPDPSDALGIERLVAALPASQREAFVLTQVLGLQYDEAAAVCDVPIGTIRSRVARAREALIGELDRAAEA
jgi:RNA polymerase sigma-70 factor (ECF subfamily)